MIEGKFTLNFFYLSIGYIKIKGLINDEKDS